MDVQASRSSGGAIQEGKLLPRELFVKRERSRYDADAEGDSS